MMRGSNMRKKLHFRYWLSFIILIVLLLVFIFWNINSGSISISLNDILEKKNLSDFRKAFSLNDRFRFRRELFGGNEEKMNKAISDLNDLSSYEESVTYLNKVLNWNIEDASVADFIKLLEKASNNNPPIIAACPSSTSERPEA